jgi:uracil-DNA glycosylase family 4
MTIQSERNAAFLDEIGVGPTWVRRNGTALECDESEEPIVVSENVTITHASPVSASAWEADSVTTEIASSSEETSIATMNWVQLKAAVSSCVQCGLCKKRTNTVFGVGDEKAKWLFVGEGPGRNEDAQGEPFVGPAGKLLDNMLLSLGLKRGANAYIANIVKCRPTDANGKDRPPTSDETDACMPYLQRQIALIQPTVIVALGKTAALALLKRDPETSVSALRGTVHRYADLPLIVTYHPAYLLRSPADKRKTWDDLCLATKTYSGASTGV